MAGVKGRSGRKSHRMECSFDEVADLTFREAFQVLNDPSLDRLKVLQVCMPLALKRIPDKIVQTNVNLAISDELSKRILAIMDATTPRTIAPPEVYVTPIIDKTCNEEQDEPKK
jgi:hypothetical protein